MASTKGKIISPTPDRRTDQVMSAAGLADLPGEILAHRAAAEALKGRQNDAVRAGTAAGMTYVDLAAWLGMTPQAVQQIAERIGAKSVRAARMRPRTKTRITRAAHDKLKRKK